MHPEVAADLVRGKDGHRDGTFWMAFEDFAAIFHSVMVCPATMPVPKSSRLATVDFQTRTSVRCGRCGRVVGTLWVLVVPAQQGGRRVARWERLKDGDLCLLC